MWWFAQFLWLVGSLPWLAMLLSAKPTRGENLTGIHLVLGPAALPPAIALALFLVVGPFGWFAALPWALLPGIWLTLAALPAIATGPRRIRTWKAVGVTALLSVGAVGARVDAAPWLPWIGFVVVAACGVASYATIGKAWLGPRLRRASASREPSEWEIGQAEFQRKEWAKAAPTTVATLLPFCRSLAPDVRAECLQKLAAHPDLDAELGTGLARRDEFDALHYLVHHYPRPRRTMARAVNERLADEHRRWAPLLSRRDDETRWLGNIVPLLDAGVAVLKDGGDVREPLARWRDTLVANPRYRPLGQQIAKYLG